MNPPYGRGIVAWMQKAYESSQQGATVVCLVPARTDTRWWHHYAKQGEIRFLQGRLKFSGSQNSAPFPSAIIVFRPPGNGVNKAQNVEHANTLLAETAVDDANDWGEV